jgi:hypothetical protein
MDSAAKGIEAMSLQPAGRYASPLGVAALAAILLFVSPTYAQRGAAAAAGPFAGLSGAWSGSGTVTLSNGSNERIRCRANYVVGREGNDLQQELRCASDSYRFELKGNVTHDGGQISGTWSEATRNTGGNVSGRATSGQVQAVVLGPGFAASLAVATRGDKQSVTIRSEGAEVSQVSITLSRSR